MAENPKGEGRKSKRSIRESEIKFRTLFNSSSDAIVLFKQGQIVDFNDKVLEVFGCTREEFKAGYPDRFLPPQQPDGRDSQTVRLDRLQAAQKTPQYFQWRNLKYDGTPFDVEVSLSPVTIKGEVVVQAIVRDITERRRIEEALRQSEAKFRSIIEYSRDGIVLFDETGRVIEWNQGLEKIFVVKREQALGLYAWDDLFQRLTPAKDIKGFFYSLLRTGDAPTLNQTMEHEFVMPDGRFHTIEEVSFAIKTDRGYMCCWFIRDITERKLAERALRESEENYRAIFENTGTANIKYGEDTIIQLANAEAERLSGYSKEEIEGKMSWTEFVTHDEIPKVKRITALINNHPEGSPRSYETKIKDRRGSIHNVIITIQLIPGTLKRVVSILDITDRKQTEEKLEYLSLHDTLTGLYNRTFFEEEMRRLGDGRRLPVGIIVCDVDGLKMVNDSLGHDRGDRLLKDAAEAIRGCFRDSDVVARIGGDEFAVLVPECSKEVAEEAVDRIKTAVTQHNQRYPEPTLSISVGYAVTADERSSMASVFKEADNNMYRDKFFRGQHYRSRLISSLIRAMEIRDQSSAESIHRLQRLLAISSVDSELIDKIIRLIEDHQPTD
ncbi:MAG: PAS domain S-box protein [Firmicutes bacterium]|nr:PAS domain S-box protein [Bacillota bacterium]